MDVKNNVFREKNNIPRNPSNRKLEAVDFEGVLTFPTFKQSLAGVCAFGRWAHFAVAYIHKYFCSIIGCQNKSVFPVCVCVSVSMPLNLFVHLEVEHKCFYSPPCGFLLPV